MTFHLLSESCPLGYSKIGPFCLRLKDIHRSQLDDMAYDFCTDQNKGALALVSEENWSKIFTYLKHSIMNMDSVILAGAQANGTCSSYQVIAT